LNEAEACPDFYVVSSRKLITLIALTGGLYVVAWFYQHWRAYRRVTGRPVWPIVRAFFAILFAFSLFSKISGGVEARGVRVSWSPLVMTLLLLVAGVASACAGSFVSTTLYVALTPIWLALDILILLSIQSSVNAAAGDAPGLGNNRMTWVNGVWMTIGMFWMLVAVAAALVLMPDTLEGWFTPMPI